MRIHLTSIFVDDQRAALAFYTDVLGFTKHHDIPLGDDFWLTVVSPDCPDGPVLLLEPAGHPAVKPYRDALAEDGIPLAQFAVDDVEAEVRPTDQARRFIHPDAHRHRHRSRRGLRRHLRQPHPAHHREARKRPDTARKPNPQRSAFGLAGELAMNDDGRPTRDPLWDKHDGRVPRGQMDPHLLGAMSGWLTSTVQSGVPW